MFNIEVISSIERLREIKKAWGKLLYESASDDLFLHPDWIFAWLRVFGDKYELELFFIALWEETRLLGLFPLCRKKIGPFRFITFVGAPVSDRMDFILKNGEEKQCIETFVRWLFRHRSWDMVSLDNFGALSENTEILVSELRKKAVTFDLAPAGRYYYTPTEKYINFEDFLKRNKTKKSLKRLRNYRNRLLKNPNSGWEVLTTLDSKTLQQMEFIDTIGSLRGNRGDSFFSMPSNKRFFQEILPSLQNNKRFEVLAYKIGNNIHAYQIIFLYNNRMLFYQTSFDKDLSQDRPGTVTCYEAIRHVFDRGYNEYDFLLGDEAYKSHWSEDYRESRRLDIYQNSLRSYILSVAFRHAKPLLKRFFKKVPKGKKTLSTLRIAPRQRSSGKKELDYGMSPSMGHIEVVDTLEGLKKIRRSWENILETSKMSDPFIHPSWIISWRESFPDTGSLFFAVSRKKQEVAGIFPLCRRSMGPFSILSFAGHPVTDRMDFILRGLEREKTLATFWKWLKSQRSWDMMSVENLCTRADTPSLIKKACELTGMKIIETNKDACYFINLKAYSDYDAYLTATFNRKHRNYFRRLDKKALALSGAKWGIEQNIDKSLIREMLVLDSQRSIRGEADQCFFNNPSSKRFLETLMTSKYFHKITNVFTFRSHRGLHAYLLFFVCDNKLLAYQTAFDKELRDLSIGTQLFLESIRYSFENRFSEYDFLRGDEGFKKRFAKGFREIKTLLIFPETWKGNMLYMFYKEVRPAAKKMSKGIRAR